MERFAIKIDKKLKANLYKICRLCGIDNPDMVPIISDKQEDNENNCIDLEAEMEMQQKINLLIGLSITKDDRMPQTMCCLCVDKINDFYEFREMCYATNAQTRKLLGLKNIKKPGLDIKPKIEVKEESIVPTSTFSFASNKNGNRKRKSDEILLSDDALENFVVTSKKKLRFSTNAEQNFKDEIPLQTKKKLRFNAMNEESMISVASCSKKSKNYAIEETKLKNEPSPPMPGIPLAISNKKLRLIPSQSTSKKSKQKGVKYAEQREADVKEEIKEEIKEELAPILASFPTSKIPPSPKLKFGCNICKERFPAKVNLETHTRTTHIPKIERFVCTACNEVLTKSFDIKNHQLWHKLSKTPYVCGCCGETILNTYAFSRHLREHAFETPPALLVLDRECPQCHISFATNFLYNIHLCAVKTKRCAGCNRVQRNDAEYLKHSAQCAKVYLNYSKHIMPSVEALEDAVRIKNENDVEAAAEEMARISGLPLDMAPVVQLTRLSSPLIMAASQCVSMACLDEVASSSVKKSGKKGVSKKDLKRVDELLKSTLDALVSIKHEPEVHVDQETQCAGDHSDNEDPNDSNEHASGLDDFHYNDDSDNESEDANSSLKIVNTSDLKAATVSGLEQIKIKQEFDESEENLNKIGGGLKLKIKKEHGQLNSSIIEQQKSSEKRAEKRKKKKKHKDKEKDKQKLPKEMHDEQVSQDSNINNYNTEADIGITTVRIKSEPEDKTEVEEKSVASLVQTRPQPEATIMTSIPMMQFQIACVSSGVEFNNATNEALQTSSSFSNHNAEFEDVKPNREELDRMLKISHVSSGIAIATEETQENETQQMDHEANYSKGNASGDNEDFYHKESNENDHHDGDIESKCHEEHANDEEVEAEYKIEGDSEKLSQDARIDKEIIAKKVKKATLQLKPKITLKPMTTITKSRNKACKSTAKTSNISTLQISAVQSGVTLETSALSTSEFTPIFIKPEPLNRGYSDEAEESEIQNETDGIMQTHSAEEQNYISSIDFNNITIKQEKDLEINDVQITQKCIKSFTELNGIKRKRKQIHRFNYVKEQEGKTERKNESVEDEEEEHETDEEDEDENVDDELEEEQHEEDDDEEVEEEENGDEEEDEEREYRELEYPPELDEKKADVETQEHNATSNENMNECTDKDNDSKHKDKSDGTSKDLDSKISLVIASVCSQANTGISHVHFSNIDDKVDHKQILENNDNVLTAANMNDTDDFDTTLNPDNDNKRLKCLENKNTEIPSYKRNTENLDTHLFTAAGSSSELPKKGAGAEIPNVTEPIKELNLEKTCHESQAHNTQPVSKSLATHNHESSDVLNTDLIHSSQQSHILDSELKSPRMAENSIGQEFEDKMLQETQFVKKQKLRKDLSQCSKRSAVDAKVKQQKNLINTIEYSREMQSSSQDLLENLPQNSQHLSSVFEMDSVKTTPLNVDCLKKLKDNQEEAMVEGVVQQPKDSNLKAQPVTRYSDNETVNDDDYNENEDEHEHEIVEEDNNNAELILANNLEEHQNYQNQEVLSQIRPTALSLHPYLEDISSSSNSLLSNSLSQTPPLPLQPVASTARVDEINMQRQEQRRLLNTEETENMLNESNDILSRRSLEVTETSTAFVGQSMSQPHLGHQLPPHMPTFNFDNINEIAENNNNANIEREQLQDEQQQHQ